MTDETKIKIRSVLSENQAEQARFKKIIESVKEQWNAIADPATRRCVSRSFKKWSSMHLNLNTIGSARGFERLQADGKLKPEQRIALAIGGWILGPGIGVEELSVARQLWKVRELVNQYLAIEGAKAGADSKRRELLNQLKKSKRASAATSLRCSRSCCLPNLCRKRRESWPLFARSLHSQSVMRDELCRSASARIRSLSRLSLCVGALPSVSSSERNELSWWVGEYNETYQRNMGRHRDMAMWLSRPAGVALISMNMNTRK